MAQTSNYQIPYPLSTDHTRLWEHYQNMALQVDRLLALPATAVGAEGGINLGSPAIGANIWADIPGTGTTITNPLARPMVCDIHLGALVRTDGASVRAGARLSGGLTLASGSGGVFLGQYPYLGSSGYVFQQAVGELTVPASATVTAWAQAMREGTAGTIWQVNFARLRIVPRRFM